MFAGNSLGFLGKDWRDFGLGWDSPGDKSMDMGAAFHPLQDVCGLRDWDRRKVLGPVTRGTGP